MSEFVVVMILVSFFATLLVVGAGKASKKGDDQ